MIWLIDYPKSGANWIAYIIENLCKIPVSGENWESCFVYNKEVHFSGKPKIQKNHLSKFMFPQHYNKDTDNLICIVRNYKESVVGHNMRIFNLENFKDRTKGYGGVDYIEVLKVFEENKNPKVLIYYEDMMTNPRPEIIKVVDFLSQFGGHTDCDNFLDNVEEHREKSLIIYGLPNSQTKGKEMIYYSKSLSKEVKIDMDKHLECEHPKLFNKYLKRYAEN